MEGSMIYQDGDIFSPNRTGHECVVCQLVSCMGVMLIGLNAQIHKLFPEAYKDYVRECTLADQPSDLLGKVLFYGVKHDGFDYNIASIFSLNDPANIKCIINHDALRLAMAPIRAMATPLPAGTLTTVRIPHKLGFDLSDGEWNKVSQIIEDELVNQGIPVEIWRTNSHPLLAYNRHRQKERIRTQMSSGLKEVGTNSDYSQAQRDIALRMMKDNMTDEQIRQYTRLPALEIEALRIHWQNLVKVDNERKSAIMNASFQHRPLW